MAPFYDANGVIVDNYGILAFNLRTKSIIIVRNE